MAQEPGRERDRAATVVRQDGNRLEVDHKGQRVTATMQGFPDGFTLKPGARVILIDDAGGVVARPLVRGIETRTVDRGAVQQRGSLSVQNQRVEMQNATLVDEERAGERYVVWVVEQAEPQAGAADQAIAVRRE